MRFIFIIYLVLLSGCGPVIPAVVEERIVTGVKQETDSIGGSVVRLVQPGDTLYAIAFDNGLDARDLAAWNDLSLDNRINVGQKLRLTKPLNFVAKTPAPRTSAPSQATNTVVSETLENSRILPTRNSTVRSEPLIPVPSSPSTSVPVQSSNPIPSTAPAHTSIPVPSSKAVTTSVPIPTSVPRPTYGSAPAAISVPTGTPSSVNSTVVQASSDWQWPLAGKLLRGFALNRGQQGVDIQGVLGQSVMASAAGEIVYAGSGLKGYGNLIIIKHDDEFLSAYAHNQAVFVKEGERVKQSSIIASMGTNQLGEPALQFQIRKGGSPVDPLTYLPPL